MFRKFNREKIESVSEYVKDYVKKHPEVEIIIGSDSQNWRFSTVYATVIALYSPGHGAHCVYNKWREKRERITSVRLINEVNASIDCAEKLVNDGAPKATYIDIDVNSSPKFKSSEVYRSARGMVEGMGYTVRDKDDAPLVTTMADFIVKHFKY